MTAFLFRAGAGTPGDVTRPAKSTVETGFLNKALYDIAPTIEFGDIVFAVPGSPGVSQTEFARTQPGYSAANFYGVLTRLAPSIAGSLDQSFGSGVANVNNPQGIGRKGYFNVKIADEINPIIRGGQVYLRVVTSGLNLIGDLGATAIAGETEALPGVVWGVDGTDANNVTEIHIQ
jgi:hypothetical protein